MKLIFYSLLAVAVVPAHADLYRRIDPSTGDIVFSNTPFDGNDRVARYQSTANDQMNTPAPVIRRRVSQQPDDRRDNDERSNGDGRNLREMAENRDVRDMKNTVDTADMRDLRAAPMQKPPMRPAALGAERAMRVAANRSGKDGDLVAPPIIPMQRDAVRDDEPPRQQVAYAIEFPQISKKSQTERDSERRRILKMELNAEMEQLEAATAKKAASEIIHRHESNIAALQREVVNAR